MAGPLDDAGSGERLSRGFLDALFERAPIGLGIWDRELRYVRVNDELAAMNGVPVEQHIGRRMADVLPELATILEPLYREVLESRRPMLRREVAGTTPAHPGLTRYWQASYYPIMERGEAIGLGAVVLEVTERVAIRKRLEEQALGIYDDVVQALTVAKMGLEIGDQDETVYATVGRALSAAKHLTSRLLVESEMTPPEEASG